MEESCLIGANLPRANMKACAASSPDRESVVRFLRVGDLGRPSWTNLEQQCCRRVLSQLPVAS